MPVEMIDSNKRVSVRVIGAFYVKGKIAKAGDVVEVDEIDARALVLCGKAELVTK